METTEQMMNAELAPALVQEKDILAKSIEALSAMGVVGEDKVVKLVYLCMTSRHLPRPVSLLVKGPSSAGKSHTVGGVLKLFPKSAYFELTAMSERALVYTKEEFIHRFVVLHEAVGLGGETGSYLVRSLLSEGKIDYMTVEKTEKGLVSKPLKKDGPTGLISTTTAVGIHPENETRHISVTVNDSPAQTRLILEAMAEGATYDFNPAEWVELQEWIDGARHEVIIPFAKAIVQCIPSTSAVRLRRDFGAVLALIKTHAILHQASRTVDDAGRIVATIEDYKAVHDLVANLISCGVEVSIPVEVRETVEAVKELGRTMKTGVTVTEVAHKLGLDRSSASRRVSRALELEYLKDENEGRRKRTCELSVIGTLPTDDHILPTAEAVTARMAAAPVPVPNEQQQNTDGGLQAEATGQV